jgi:ribose-phosphate pyrophosphokinase
LRATPLLARRYRTDQNCSVVAVSPDAGGVTRAEDFRTRVGGSLAIISKRRPSADATEVLEMVGDVDGKAAVVIDDMISTASTLTAAAELLRERGAEEIHAAATHGVFSGDALERIQRSPISKVYVTDTLPLPDGESRDLFEVVTVAPLLAEAIMRIHKDLSVSALFT